jgi:hypothetical protein
MRVLLITIGILSAFLLGGCASKQRPDIQALSESERLLVGTWEADVHDVRWVITRRPDHTFAERAIKIYDSAKPAIRVESAGTWQIEGNRYCKRFSSVSESKWWPQPGYEMREKILTLTPTQLVYFPNDSPVIIERKLSATEASSLLKRPLNLTGTERNHPVEASKQ